MLLCGFKLSEFFLTVRLLMAWSGVVSALSIGAFGADFGIDLGIALLYSEPSKVSSSWSHQPKVLDSTLWKA
jgi:hypothetical protein